MASSQSDKALLFRDLHQQDSAFIVPNPWDVGSARLLEALGFKALATTSAGFAFSKGRPDNAVTREEVMEHLNELASATMVPISADLENGFGDSPEDAAQTIRQAAEAGVVGGSIEDTNNHLPDPVYEFGHAVDRVRAAVEAARSLPFTFTLTARAENYIVGRPDLADTIKRLQAYQEAGADVLFAPGLKTMEDIKAVVSSVDRPVNVLMGFPGLSISAQQLSEIGVKRVSVGGSLARAALGAFLRAGRELRDQGTFAYGNDAVSMKEITGLLRPSQS